MHDKRKVRRRHLLYFLRLSEATTNNIVGDLQDLTPEGLMVVGTTLLEPGQEYRLVMNLPPDVFRNPRLEFTARCIWSRPDPQSARFYTGFSLVDISTSELETIVSLITEYGAPE